jgi:hypothetical protein
MDSRDENADPSADSASGEGRSMTERMLQLIGQFRAEERRRHGGSKRGGPAHRRRRDDDPAPRPNHAEDLIVEPTQRTD